MGTVDNRVDKFLGNFGDSTYTLFSAIVPDVIQGGSPQVFLRVISRLIEKMGNLHTYSYY